MLTRTLDPKREWIVRFHIGCRGKQGIVYKPKRKTQKRQYLLVPCFPRSQMLTSASTTLTLIEVDFWVYPLDPNYRETLVFDDGMHMGA